MRVIVTPVVVSKPIRVIVLNRFLGTSQEVSETAKVSTYQAEVNGVPWTVDQTEQAIRDSRLCTCRTCAACTIARAVRSLN